MMTRSERGPLGRAATWVLGGALVLASSLVLDGGLAAAAGVTSDDFAGAALDTMWTEVDPVGDGHVATDGSRLLMSVPANTKHDAWADNTALRVMQSAVDEDFEVEVKFDSALLEERQSQGVLFEESPGNYVRFDLFGNASEMRAFAASTVGGTSTSEANEPAGAGGVSPVRLRVSRVGDDWTGSYSTDGSTFTEYVSFTHPMVVNEAGPFVGNSGASPPAFTAVVDYFFDTSAPIVPEDGDAETGYSVDTTTVGSGSVVLDPPGGSYLHDTVVSVEAMPDVGSEFTAWSGDLSGSVNPESLTMTGNRSVTATFVELPPPTIDVWYGDEQSFGQIGTPQNFINVLGNVSAPETITSLTYSLNGAAPVHLEVGPDTRRLERAGDFNIDLPIGSLDEGVNQVTIVADDVNGHQTERTVEVDYTGANTWPLPYTIDWSAAADIQSVAQVVDGKWEITPDGLRTVEIGYDRLVAIGDMSWPDYEVTVPITVHDLGIPGPVSGKPMVGVLMRWQGHTNDPEAGWQPLSGWMPNGNIGRWRDGKLGWVDPSGDTTPFDLLLDVEYIFKLRVETNGTTSSYTLTAWPADGDESSAVPVVVDETPDDLGSGSLVLLAHHVDATFGNVTVTRAPDAPSGVSAVAGDAEATVSWSAPVSDGGSLVTGYMVTSSPGGETCSTTGATSCVVSGLTNGTSYTFTVRAENAVATGPASAPSAAVTPTAPPPPPAGAPDYLPLVPGRVLETRSGWSTVSGGLNGVGRVGAGRVIEVPVVGLAGVPGDAAAVSLNVTMVNPAGPGFATVFPCGATLPNASNINYVAGGVYPNAVLSEVGVGGKVCVFTLVESDILVDVNGAFRI